jgi:hypothetical protein
LIELEATHKVPEEKKILLRRLGLDTVEVLLPKGPSDEIESAFKTTSKTKWLFNAKEYRTPYVQPPDRSPEDVSSFDELQRRLFQESYACRSALVGNLTRKIERCLESDEYRKAERRLRSDLSRATRNARTAKERLRDLQKRHRVEVETGYSSEIARLDKEESELGQEEDAFETKASDLEGRYLNTKGELDAMRTDAAASIGELEQHTRDARRSLKETTGKLYKHRRAELSACAKTIRAEAEELGSVATEAKRIDSANEQLAIEEAGFPEWSGEQEVGWRAKHAAAFRTETDGIERIEASAREEFASLENRRGALERDFEEARGRVAQTAMDPNDKPPTDFGRRVKTVFSRGERVAHYAETEARRKRVERLLKDFRTGAYESWYKRP